MPSVQLDDRAILTRSFPQGDLVLHAGERGTVADIDPDYGHILFRLDRHYPQLKTWNNMLQIDAAQIGTTLSPLRPLPLRLLGFADKFSHPILLLVVGIMFCLTLLDHFSHHSPAVAGERVMHDAGFSEVLRHIITTRGYTV